MNHSWPWRLGAPGATLTDEKGLGLAYFQSNGMKILLGSIRVHAVYSRPNRFSISSRLHAVLDARAEECLAANERE
jgi:hypothetical protein